MDVNNDNFLSDNLKELRKQKGLSQNDFAEYLGVKRSTYRDYENGTNEPGLSFLGKVSGTFGISIDCLVKHPLNSCTDNEKLKVLAITVDDEGREYIEYVPQQARAGYTTGYGDAEFIKNLYKFRLPGLPVGTYRAFEISGDSMPPVDNGSILIGKYVENVNQIKNLSTYLLVTKNDGVVYKRVINRARENGKLILLSDNPAYEPYFIDASEVTEIWQYYAHLSFNPSGEKEKLNEILLKLQLLGDEVGSLNDLAKKTFTGM